ncbi:MAG: chromosomal replication initiator protein DnaA [Pseudomonadota bacterium]
MSIIRPVTGTVPFQSSFGGLAQNGIGNATSSVVAKANTARAQAAPKPITFTSQQAGIAEERETPIKKGTTVGVDFDGAQSFRRVTEQLKTVLGAETYKSWFARVELVEATPSIVQMSVPTLFLKSWIAEHYMAKLHEMWKAEIPTLLRVELLVRSATRSKPQPKSAGTAPSQSKVLDKTAKTSKVRANSDASLFLGGSKAKNDKTTKAKPAEDFKGTAKISGSAIDPRYTLDSFVEGPSNRVALAAARALVENNPNAARFNPLFFYSSVGLGKTHLLQAIANEVRKADPKKRIVYLTAEYFMHVFASAIQSNSALMLKQSLHEIDLLIIDDMQFLQGEKIQSEFCHLINALLDSARTVIAAADRPPSELESLDKRVRSRLHSGVGLEIGAPDFDMRLRMLKERLADARSEDMTLNLDDDVLEHVARTVTSSFRELEGALHQLVFRHSVDPDIRIDRVDEILRHLVRVDDRKRIRIEDIQRVVSNHYDIARTELLSSRRTRKIVRPRQVAMYLSKQMTLRSLPEIGRRFGGRDHTTVLHAVKKVEELKETDATLAKEIELLRRLIEE